MSTAPDTQVSDRLVTTSRPGQTVEPSPSRLRRLLVPTLVAGALTASVAGVGVASADAPSSELVAGHAAAAASRPLRVTGTLVASAEDVRDRSQQVSRAAPRVRLEERPIVTDHRFATTEVNVRQRPGADSRAVTVLDFAERVGVTTQTRGEWSEVVLGGESAWVNSSYLVPRKPRPEPQPEPATPSAGSSGSSASSGSSGAAAPAVPAPTGLSTAPCAAGSAVEAGLTANAVAVYRAVCAQFPMITSYGGLRGDGEHVNGQAIDVMVSGELGWQVAEYLRAHAGELNLYDVIYAQNIWTADRSAEGWRAMEDRGSVTANHYDHVHVMAY